MINVPIAHLSNHVIQLNSTNMYLQFTQAGVNTAIKSIRTIATLLSAPRFPFVLHYQSLNTKSDIPYVFNVFDLHSTCPNVAEQTCSNTSRQNIFAKRMIYTYCKCGLYSAKGGMQDSALNAGHWELAHVQEVQTTGMGLSRFSPSNMADVTMMGQVYIRDCILKTS